MKNHPIIGAKFKKALNKYMAKEISQEEYLVILKEFIAHVRSTREMLDEDQLKKTGT